MAQVTFAALGFLVLAGLITLAVIKSQQSKKRDAEELRLRVEAGTHLPNGKVRCALSYCDNAAELSRWQYSRGRGLWAWFKGTLGAPQTYSVELVAYLEGAYCAGHTELSRAKLLRKLSEAESIRLDAALKVEEMLGHAERQGVQDELEAMGAQSTPTHREPSPAAQEPS